MSDKIHKDKIVNIISIIWDFDLVYIIKFGIVVFMCRTVHLSNQINELNPQNLLPILTFVISLFIDCIVSGKFVKNNLKDFLLIHFILFVIIFSGFIYVALVYTQQINIDSFSVNICNGFSIFCCVTPLMEMFYDVNSRLQNEKNSNY